MNIVLASSSTTRRSIIAKIFPDALITYISPDIDEKAIGGIHRDNNDAEALVLCVANAKAIRAMEMVKSDCIIIACDEVAFCNGKILEKPKNKDELLFFLNLYNSHSVRTVCGIVCSRGQKRVEGLDWATTHWKKQFSPEDIEQILTQKHLYHCCGGFSINHDLFKHHELEGEPESIMGLPVNLTKNLVYELCKEQQ